MNSYLTGLLFGLPLIGLGFLAWVLLTWRHSQGLRTAFQRSHWLQIRRAREVTDFFDADIFLAEQQNVQRFVDWFDWALRLARKEHGEIDRLAFIENVAGPVGTLGSKDLLTYRTGIPSLVVRLRRRLPIGRIKGRMDDMTRSRQTGSWVRVALVGDVLTSGSTVLDGVELLRGHGAEVVYVMVIYDREEGGREHLSASGIPVLSMLKKSDELAKQLEEECHEMVEAG